MDLISRKMAIETLALNTDYQTPDGIKNDLINHPGKECDWLGGIDEAISIIEELPSVPAVPLDKLCEWLEVHARTPIYNLRHTAEWWKESLTKWMENHLAADALSLLKAQEPRVMTLTEVMVYDNRNGCIWYEDETKNIVPAFVFSEGYRRTSGIVGVMSPCFTFIAKPQYHRFERMEGYGKTWRCWTLRPTDEQRKAVKWE